MQVMRVRVEMIQGTMEGMKALCVLRACDILTLEDHLLRLFIGVYKVPAIFRYARLLS